MSIGDLLRERQDTIVKRWAEVVFSAYHPDAAVLFQKQRDPFANPVGKSVRDGTRGIFQAILNGVDPEDLRSHLDEILRVRAVQEFSPSEALSFVFSLRSIIGDAIPETREDSRLRKELNELNETIDGVALEAFDLYSERREEVAQLRVKEVKRQMAWVLKKMNLRDGEPGDPPETPEEDPASPHNVQREDLR